MRSTPTFRPEETRLTTVNATGLLRIVTDLQSHLVALDEAGEDRAAMYLDAAIIELAPKLGGAGVTVLREQRRRAIRRARRS